MYPVENSFNSSSTYNVPREKEKERSGNKDRKEEVKEEIKIKEVTKTAPFEQQTTKDYSFPFLRQIRESHDRWVLKGIKKAQQRTLVYKSKSTIQLTCLGKSIHPVAMVPDVFYHPVDPTKRMITNEEGLLYNRDELISHLRVIGAYLVDHTVLTAAQKDNIAFKDFEGLKEESILELIAQLRTSPHVKKPIESIETPFYVDYKDIDIKIKKLGLLRGLQKYISSYDCSDAEKSFLDKDPDFPYFDRPGYAVKAGDENIRELLAQKLLASLNLAEYLVTKVQTDLPIQLGNTEGPQHLIASKWLSNAQSLPLKKVSKLLQAQWELGIKWKTYHFLHHCLQKQHLDEKESEELEALGFDTSSIELRKTLRCAKNDQNFEIKKLKKEVEDLEFELIDELDVMQETRKNTNEECEKEDKCPRDEQSTYLKNLVRQQFEEAVQEHALIDILFFSYDSHSAQYLIQDGVPLDVDFAKFLPPSCVFNIKSSYYVPFRSFFFDFPASKRSLSPKLIKKILSWDVKKLKNEYLECGMIGDKGERDELTKISHYEEELTYLLNQEVPSSSFDLYIDKKIYDLSLIYEKKCSFSGTPTEQGNSALAFLKNRKNELSSSLFARIHPNASENFIQRLHLMQRYVKNDNRPTIEGAFYFLYPDLKPFIQTLSRWEPQPGFHLGITRQNELQSLNDIIEKTKSNGHIEEAKQLKVSLERLQKQAVQSQELALAMSFGITQ